VQDFGGFSLGSEELPTIFRKYSSPGKELVAILEPAN